MCLSFLFWFIFLKLIHKKGKRESLKYTQGEIFKSLTIDVKKEAYSNDKMMCIM